MATRTKKAKWENDGCDAAYVKAFGPVKVHAYRHWGTTPNPTEWRWYLTVGHAWHSDYQTPIAVDSLGVDWFDDEADKVALVRIEKLAKAMIRGWLKS